MAFLCRFPPSELPFPALSFPVSRTLPSPILPGSHPHVLLRCFGNSSRRRVFYRFPPFPFPSPVSRLPSPVPLPPPIRPGSCPVFLHRHWKRPIVKERSLSSHIIERSSLEYQEGELRKRNAKGYKVAGNSFQLFTPLLTFSDGSILQLLFAK